MTSNEIMYLRALAEDTNDGVMDILGRSTIDSSVLLTKAAVVFGKDLTKIKTTRDLNLKKKLYQKALADARKMRQTANSIPPDGIADHVWRLFTRPWWSSGAEYARAIEHDENISELTKNATVAKFDILINYLVKQLEELEAND